MTIHVRGGSWFNQTWLCRSAFSYSDIAGSGGDGAGFRLIIRLKEKM